MAVQGIGSSVKEQGSTASPPALSFAEIAAILPAWQPEAHLPALILALQQAGLQRMVVIDDGSTADRQALFAELARRPGVTVCRHSQNLGKGRALKTGFATVLGSMPEVRAVVTADADGQHLPENILRVAARLTQAPACPVLGVRTFAAGVPFRSRFGNLLTRYAFRLITGWQVSDTQTGLRGLPVALLPDLLQLPGERYEYEIVMLAHLCQKGDGLTEEPIQTVYLHGNRGSHFRLFRDSYKVYRALLLNTERRHRAGVSGRSKAVQQNLRTT